MTVSEPQALGGSVRAKRASRRASPAAQALRGDVVRRAASHGGTLRCAEARRVAYRDVDKSYASHRRSLRQRTDMKKQILAAVIRPNEPESTVVFVRFDCSTWHSKTF